MMRSVTFAIVGFSVIALLVPADAVALGERNRRRRAPGPRAIRLGADALLDPGSADPVDPRPLGLDLVAADEQCRVAVDQVEQQPLIGDPPAVFAESVGQP